MEKNQFREETMPVSKLFRICWAELNRRDRAELRIKYTKEKFLGLDEGRCRFYFNTNTSLDLTEPSLIILCNQPWTPLIGSLESNQEAEGLKKQR
ncbi:hypothetical protein NC651_038861 [Populus alba x Populus x berolinensis]|nr:hypothetical protein NC651_038861 [Populus alba x Populus x berolinensis]